MNLLNYLKKSQKIVKNIILVSGSLMLLFPLYWMFVSSFMTDSEFLSTSLQLLPKRLYLDNYRELFLQSPAVRWFFNSVFIGVVTTAAVVIISTMAGYSFAKGKFKFRNLIFLCMVFTIMIPRQILLIPLFSIVRDLNWIDTYKGVIIPALGWPFGVFLMRQFTIKIPDELINAAEIDGCSEMGIFWRIIMPLAKPGMGALAIFTFIQSWNSYMWQLIVINSVMLKTLPLGVAGFQNQFAAKNGIMMAGAVIATLPMVIVFLTFQNYFTKGLTVGAIKG